MSNTTEPETMEVEQKLLDSKPPFLRRVQIRNYKSIAFCDVTLEPLTILVGRNASGKSNFVDALEFTKDILEKGLNKAIMQRNGWDVIRCKTSENPIFKFGIEAEYLSHNNIWVANYEYIIKENDHKEIIISDEQLRLRKDSSNIEIGFESQVGQDIKWIGSKYFESDTDWNNLDDISNNTSAEIGDPRYVNKRRDDRLLLSYIDEFPFYELSENILSISKYHFHIAAIREHQPRADNITLDSKGENLAACIGYMKESNFVSLKRVIQYLATIVPTIVDLYRINYGDRQTIQFLTQVSNESKLTFDASSMSDGTLRALATLVAAFQSKVHELNGVIAIEEPETSLHPGAIHALLDSLDEATLRKQILLTSHSAEMLDNPTIKPENIRVVEMIDGQTVIAPVDEASVAIVKEKLGTLGGLERDNQLEPDMDDLERQKKLSLNGRGPKA